LFFFKFYCYFIFLNFKKVIMLECGFMSIILFDEPN